MVTKHTGTRIFNNVFAACNLFVQITSLSTLLLAIGNAFLKLAIIKPTTGTPNCANACATIKSVRKIMNGM
jgi:hypothetical protein